MDPLEAIGHRLLDPTTAYLLFVLGTRDSPGRPHETS